MGECRGKALPDKWWRDPKLLVREVEKHGTIADAARAHGVPANLLRKGWSDFSLPPRRGGVKAKAVVVDGHNDDTWLVDLLKKQGDLATVEQLADAADVSPKRVRESLERLTELGYRVAEDEGAVELARHPTETGETHRARPELFEGDLFRYAALGDTHLGSKAERLDALETAYEVIAREGIRTVYHSGDLVDGYGIYRGQNTEVLLHTYEDQVEHATDTYPVRDGVTTYIVSGNHDLEGDFGKAGADPVQAVANRRQDFEYLGRYSAWVELPNGARMHILHPQGGGSYATSYRPQKHVESYEGGDKPSILHLGHWHKSELLPGYRGVQILQTGTFQGPTTYSTRKALGNAGWGFWLVDCRLADDGTVVRFRAEWCPFYLNR